MLKKTMATVLSLILVFPVVGFAFSDMSGHWSQSDVQLMVDEDIVSGYPDGSFRPENNITRAEFAVMLSRLIDIPEDYEGATIFYDCGSVLWFNRAVCYLYDSGIITGVQEPYSKPMFYPNELITREDMAVIIVRFLETTDYQYPYATNSGLRFSDRDAVSEYANNAVFNLTMRTDGIMTGYGKFQPDRYPTDQDYYVFLPQNPATRAEATTVIARVFTAIK